MGVVSAKIRDSWNPGGDWGQSKAERLGSE